MHTRIKPLTTIALLVACSIAANSQAQKVVADKIVAVVGDKIILQSDIKNAIAGSESQEGNLPAEAGCMLMKQALTSKILMLQAEKDSLHISDEELEAELDQRIRYYIKKFGGKDKLEEYAQKTIYQIKDDAREPIKENMLAEAMQQKIVKTISITPSEVNAFFDRIPKDKPPFVDAELEVGQITLIPKASGDMERYIVAELNNYKRQVKNNVASFERLAQLHSEHLESRKHGGYLQINRNEKALDPAILSASFRLKDGEISDPIKSSSSEYFLVQMIQKSGDDADIRLISRTPPVTVAEMNKSKEKLDTIRSKIIVGAINFREAAAQFSDDPAEKNVGPFLLNQDGSPYVTIQQMDNEMVVLLSKMKIGEISTPIDFITNENKKAVRIVYLKSRSKPHILNLQDDYRKIAQAALEEKKKQALNNWMESMIFRYFIVIDDGTKAECPILHEYASSDTKDF